jgi:hypothetical protein
MPENRSQSVANKIKKSTEDSSQSPMTFPKGLNRGIAFSFDKYSLNTSAGGVGAVPRTNTVSGASIVLPLPKSGLAESTEIDAQPTQLGIEGMLSNSLFGSLENADTAYQAGKDVASSGRDMFSWMTNKLVGSNAEPGNTTGTGGAGAQFIVKAAARRFSSIGGTAIQTGIDTSTGTAMNNFSTVAFNDVRLRQFTFSWTFLPESEEEVNYIEEIKNKFKRFALPRYSSANPTDAGWISRVLFEYPHICNASLFGVDRNSFFSFKPAMIQSIQTSYRGPDGHVAFLKGGKPAMIDLSLTMQEIAIWTAEDY